jgi:indole-3-glycerol phosphate synthase
MNILDTIIEHKVKEVKERMERMSVKVLERSDNFSRPTYSLTQALVRPGATGIIAEIKRKSPSQGIIHNDVSIEAISTGYVEAGASALSILTDQEFFGGTMEDLALARQLNTCPILRKDFMIDPYQIIEAKAIGADVILLIAAALSPEKIREFAKLAHDLNLEVLLEVHDEEELNRNLDSGADLIGVNNRNLKTFEVSIDVSRKLANQIPDSISKVSESGIENAETIHELRQLGYTGFLMGQNFMKQEKPERACREFIEALNR